VLGKTVAYGATIAALLFAFVVLQELIIDNLVDTIGVPDGFLGARLRRRFPEGGLPEILREPVPAGYTAANG
jgi:hypothetical protein